MLQEFRNGIGHTDMQTASNKCAARLGRLAALMFTSTLLATSAFAAQDVSFVSTGGASLGTSQTVAAGGSITVVGRYSVTAPQTANESGLGLKLKYDATKLTPVVNSYSTKCAIAPPQIQANGATSQVVMGFIDTSIRAGGAVGWPGTADVASPNGCLEIAGITQDDAAKALPYDIFSVTFTTAAGYGTAAIQMVTEGNISYANTGNADINKTLTLSSSGGTLSLAATNPYVSRKTHGAAGVFDLTIDPAGSEVPGAASVVTVEPRQAQGGTHQIVLKFTGGSGTLSAAEFPTANITAKLANTATDVPFTTSFPAGTNEMVITLGNVGTPVANGTRVKVTATGAGAAAGVNPSVAIGFLFGDVNGNRTVQPSDALFIQQRLGATTATNFKGDINVNGNVQPSDALAVQQRLGNNLP
jgi:Dockerin type I domain